MLQKCLLLPSFLFGINNLCGGGCMMTNENIGLAQKKKKKLRKEECLVCLKIYNK